MAMTSDCDAQMGEVIELNLKPCRLTQCDPRTGADEIWALPTPRYVLGAIAGVGNERRAAFEFADRTSAEAYGAIANVSWTTSEADYHRCLDEIRSESDLDDERYACVDYMLEAEQEFRIVASLLGVAGWPTPRYVDSPVCLFSRSDGHRVLCWRFKGDGGAFVAGGGVWVDGTQEFRFNRRDGCGCASCISRHDSASLERSGWVYFAQRGASGPIKIGTAENVVSRLSQLQTGSPEQLRLLLRIRGGYAVERMIHTQLREHRIRGEWFNAARDVIGLIEELRGRRGGGSQ